MGLHIDDFRTDCAIILLRLYNNFPRAYTIYISDICPEGYEDEFGLLNKRYEACLSTLFWLADEKLIQYKSVMPTEGVEQATLTLKGFQLLISTSKQEQKRRIESVRDAIKSKSSKRMTDVMDELMLSINH